MPKISADEFVAKRKDHTIEVGGKVGVVKAAKSPPSWDPARRAARFVMTTEQKDRYGDIVRTKGLHTEEFLKNPVGLLFHNSRTWPVATWENLEVRTLTRPPRLTRLAWRVGRGWGISKRAICASASLKPST